MTLIRDQDPRQPQIALKAVIVCFMTHRILTQGLVEIHPLVYEFMSMFEMKLRIHPKRQSYLHVHGNIFTE